MTADVSYVLRMINANSKSAAADAAVITRDFLVNCSPSSSSTTTAVDTILELDLDFQVPSGYEKRLDLKSGKVYLQRCIFRDTSASSSQINHQINQTVPKLRDLNSTPASRKSFNIFDNTSLDVKLVRSSSPPSTANYQSVCTLDKVKSALERAEKETNRKRSIYMSQSSSPSNSSTSTNDNDTDHACLEEKSSPSFAAGCPSCLLYVLISKNNPRCPHCNITVPSPKSLKKPRIDLNISI